MIYVQYLQLIIRQLLQNKNCFPTASHLPMIEEAVSFYNDDLPNPTIIDEDFCRWTSKWLFAPKDDRTDTIVKSLRECSPAALPNIYTLHELFATLPMSSCSCERSGSTLKHLNSYLRSSQTEERLSTLTLIHINYSDFNIDEICKRFLQKHPRRSEKASLLFNF